MKRYFLASLIAAAAIAGLSFFLVEIATPAGFTAQDPGPRKVVSNVQPATGDYLPTLTAAQIALANASKTEFISVEGVPDGLGPRMNLDSCVGCHSYPAVGGSSPPVNPQVAFATSLSANNSVPSFITKFGPVREARFVKNPDGSADGGVHSIFTITGRTDAPKGCALSQPDFATALQNNNVIFRIPTPTFGAGLIEQIPDATILANLVSNAALKQRLGIRSKPNIVLAGNAVTGQPNLNGNDGTIARFGWKAQSKSLLLFSGEAYNVEMGITNDLFQTEREENPTCNSAAMVPNDATTTNTLSAIEQFAVFMRFLGPPIPSINTPGGQKSIAAGYNIFKTINCDQCHTPALVTGNSTVAALRYQTARLYSDLGIHDMGPGLADGVSQGQAGPSEFRTAPLWGLGQRIFFLHDGRTTDLIVAIRAHQSGSTSAGNASEANQVITNFNNLPELDKQDLLNFLRSL